MEEIQRQLQKTRGSLKEMGMGVRPKETDTMAAARSDDEEAATQKSEVVEETTDTVAAARGNTGEAAITTNDATAAASAIATEAIRVHRGVVEEAKRRMTV